MTDNVWKRAEVESPCVKICVIHPESRLCTGCLRSMDEITIWSKLSLDARRMVIDDLPNRQSRLTKRKGGRAARLAQ